VLPTRFKRKYNSDVDLCISGITAGIQTDIGGPVGSDNRPVIISVDRKVGDASKPQTAWRCVRLKYKRGGVFLSSVKGVCADDSVDTARSVETAESAIWMAS
jgi:RecA/RadA recombinase